MTRPTDSSTKLISLLGRRSNGHTVHLVREPFIVNVLSYICAHDVRYVLRCVLTYSLRAYLSGYVHEMCYCTSMRSRDLVPATGLRSVPKVGRILSLSKSKGKMYFLVVFFLLLLNGSTHYMVIFQSTPIVCNLYMVTILHFIHS